jgi:hypothetical protein
MTTWSQRVIELEAAGRSITAIAAEVGMSQQALSDVKAGRSKEPRGMAAVRLHALHSALVAQNAADAPEQDEAA